MLRSPLELLGQHRGSLIAVGLVLTAAFWLLAALLAGFQQARHGVGQWWADYAPVVYLDADASESVRVGLAEELETWSPIRAVEVEDASVTFERLQDQLGVEEVEALGITPRFLPVRLVVDLRAWGPGEGEAMAQLKALEVRPEVIAVDVPAPRVRAQVNRVRSVLFGLAAMVVILFFAAFGNLAVFLRRLQEEEGLENHLLEVFGASPMALRRPTIWRGATLGAGSGVVAGALFLPWSFSLDRVVAGFVTSGGLEPVSAALFALALPLVGLLGGSLVGWVSAKPGRPHSVGKMESLLGWERE
jgi:cell division protein FtsX